MKPLPTVKPLPDDLRRRVATLSERGDALAAAGNFNAAHARYAEALALLPPPATEWSVSQWLLAAMADADFHRAEWDGCRQNLQRALDQTPSAADNAFIRLRLGQALLELDETDAAYDHLFEAFRIGGEDLFLREDPKYITWLRERVASE